MQTLKNIEAVAVAANSSMDDFHVCNVALADVADFSAMNSVYANFFGTVKPTRMAGGSTLAGSGVVEIQCSATAPNPSAPLRPKEAPPLA